MVQILKSFEHIIQINSGSWRRENQCTCSCITSHTEFFWWNIKSPRWSAPLQPRFGTLQLLAFPQTKITFEREEISDCWESGKYQRAADGDWENCVRFYSEGDWGIVVLWQCFLYFVSSSISVSISHYMAGCLLDRPHTHMCLDLANWQTQVFRITV